MLAAERHEKIVRVVLERGSARVAELSRLCGVTEETIRRDLDRLEASGRLRRSHGGAVGVQTPPETPYFEREMLSVEEKRNIARLALEFIEPGERIILDASTTAWHMASMMPDITLTVLTNSINVAKELSVKEKMEVICTGGVLSPLSLSFVGPLAERSLERYYVNKAFLSCKGLHPEKGVSESNEDQARVKSKMIEQADEVFLLADSSKIGVQAFTRVASWEAIRKVVTDAEAPADFVAQLSGLGIEVIQIE
ncbi:MULTISPECIES: DeoR/GlpR family DNA-binding transcription regulator [unclassified Paenibacillus]|uniref:DeoR/GlpR family DNA-binding transcription regulator n=1 Tax=unclassified Paenibacillus TaxID=185978 RepID=UPI001C0F58C2|nr:MULTISPECIES: DeoR/GlpR family DNA-binding transcription regulator [unclassified Paenibacillus]MBU5441982.1 DeoR/GlpR family DNA-binding transcription regulator [Paenibacillus sp. MSJ-34]CAH0118195.1 putative HTH-type transcriptional regulator YdjF [Paenibacillus sp. CECT 9249]